MRKSRNSSTKPTAARSSRHAAKIEPPAAHGPRSGEELTAQNVRTIAAVDQKARERASRSDRVATAITDYCGSMSFFWLHVIGFTIWIGANTIPGLPHPDPFPFSLLTLAVSLEAIFLSTFIMIAENRQQQIEERRSHLDLQINLLAEQENTKMLELLGKIAAKLGIDAGHDPTINALEEATRPEVLVSQIDETAAQVERTRKTRAP